VGSASVDSKQKSVFGTFSADELDSSSVKAFQHLFDLRDNLYKYTATGGTNQTDIQRGIGDIDEILESVVSVHSEQGGRDQRLTLAMNRHEDNKINTKSLLSKHEDTDMTEAISRLVLMQNVYQAALGSGAKIIQTTLLAFLR
jgi:flagellar hook-associated protein 3 FlgL